MAFGAPGVSLILITKRLSEKTITEASELVAAGCRLSLYQSNELHDRWFAVDGMWFSFRRLFKGPGKALDASLEAW